LNDKTSRRRDEWSRSGFVPVVGFIPNGEDAEWNKNSAAMVTPSVLPVWYPCTDPAKPMPLVLSFWYPITELIKPTPIG
jgi:hypothetical protein